MKTVKVPVKVKADVEKALGKKLAANLLKTRTGGMQAKPRSIEFVESKPSFALNDGSLLYAYGANVQTGELTGKKYCGSGDSAMLHPEQGLEGEVALPPGHALIFVESYWNGTNHSWTVTVVSKELVKQLEGKS